MAKVKQLRKSNLRWDKGGSTYRQLISIDSIELNTLIKAIKSEMENNFPRAKEYAPSYNYLQPLELSGDLENIAYMNLTTTRFVNLFLNLELDNTVNTCIQVVMKPTLYLAIEDFDELYKPIQNPFSDEETSNIQLSNEELNYVVAMANENPRKVWTVMDSDDGIIVANGYSLVNRIHYIITENECLEDDVVVYYCDELSDTNMSVEP